MAKDVTNSEDVEMAECEEDKVVTMMDVLQEQEDFEEDANAVLGASDDKNCTYSKGYIKRQALYACMTCCSGAKSDPSKRAGLCLACSLICHENHELVELYTKRNFRCDCGNSKFNTSCQLAPNKVLQNEENNYNQNFSGLYCVCKRPYPDPENKVEDEMIQCTICEDWLHSSHLETTVPTVDQYSEMICKGCMEKNVFLYSYSDLIVNIDNTEVDIIGINENGNKNSNICNGEVETDKLDIKIDDSVQSQESKDIDMSEKIPETTCTEHKTENNKKNYSSVNSSKKTNHHPSENNQDNLLCEKEAINEPEEASSDSPMISDNTVKPSNEIPESENVEKLVDVNSDCNMSEIEKDESQSDNLSQQNTNDQPNQSPKDDSVSKNNEVMDNKAEVTSQENDTVTTISLKKETGDSNCTTETTINSKNKIDDEKIEENRLLGDPEDANSNSKSNLDNEKSDDSKNTCTMENPSNDEQNTEHVNSNIEQNVDSETPSLPNKNITNNSDCDQEQLTKLENEVSQDASISGDKEVENTELLKENKTNNEEAESKTENPIEDNIVATTSNEESASMEPSTSNSGKESEPNSQDKVTEKRKLSTEESYNNVVVKKTKLEESNNMKSCICPRNVKKAHKGATFWPSNFRQKLCTCRECLTLYKDLSVLYLIDPEDTVSAYESLGIEKTNGKPSQYEKGLQALSSLDRIQQINALTEYNKMRDKLLDFLKSFKDRKEIVKEEDIKAFFAEMKPKREPDGVYFCR